MLASTHTLKLHAVPPEHAGARTFVAALPLANGAVARHEATEMHPRSWRGRGAVFLDHHLAWKGGHAPRRRRAARLSNPRAYALHDACRHPCSACGQRWTTIPPFAFETLEHFLTMLCGGYTRRGDVEGAWRSPETGEVMRDRSRSYVVTLAAEEAGEQIARIESFIRRYFRQEAAFLELIPTRATAF